MTRKSSFVAALLVSLVCLNSLDTMFTMNVVMKGVEEANPFMRWLIELHPLTFVIVKMLLGPLTVGILWTFRFHRLSTIGAILTVSVYTLVCAWHLYGILVTGIKVGAS